MPGSTAFVWLLSRCPIQPHEAAAVSADAKPSEVVLPSLPPRFHHVRQDNCGLGHALVLRETELSILMRNPTPPRKEKKKVLNTDPSTSFKLFVSVRRTRQRVSESEMKNVHVWPHLSVTGSRWWQFYMDKWLGTDGTSPDVEKFTWWLPRITLIKSAHSHSSVMSNH